VIKVSSELINVNIQSIVILLFLRHIHLVDEAEMLINS
jgi:hypothetical protein